MLNPIYRPKGAALEYCEYGLNIYDSCSNSCTYCYARPMAARFGKPWGDTVNVRPGLLDALADQLFSKPWFAAGRLIHLCFTCDPYPVDHDSNATRAVIILIKQSGNHVQILTKGDETAQRDFDLLSKDDWFGVTNSGAEGSRHEPGAAFALERFNNLRAASEAKIKTWVSCEPVFVPAMTLRNIEHAENAFIDLWRIGKLNHQKSNINWGQFGHAVEALCKRLGRNYYIKSALRKEMEKSHDH